jgi:hypothetical protein
VRVAAADLLGGVDAGAVEHLSPVQRVAVDRMLLRGNDAAPIDERIVATAFRSVIEQLAGDSPVLVAIDDVQWLDVASRANAIEESSALLICQLGVARPLLT